MRCDECETVHSVQKERERLVNLKVIVNKDEESEPYHIKIPAKEVLRVGEELLVDDRIQGRGHDQDHIPGDGPAGRDSSCRGGKDRLGQGAG